MQEFPDIGILHRRKIEAEIIKPIYEILVRDYGKEVAKAIIGEAVGQAAVNAGKSSLLKSRMVQVLRALSHYNIFGNRMML